MLLLALAAPPAPASAQADRTPAEAVELFRSAREHYREGRYREASVDLERALVLDPGSATLRYNLARVYELLGELEQSLVHYRQYLSTLGPSEAEERARTEATIARLAGAIASGERQSQAAAESQPFRELSGRIVVRERGVADLPFWITLGGGAAVLAAAAITGPLALDSASQRDGLVLRDPAEADALTAEYDSLDSRAQNLGLATDVLLSIGAAALITSLLLFVLRETEIERDITEEDSASLAPFFVQTNDASIAGLRGMF